MSLGEVQSLHDDDIHAANTLHDQDRVQLQPNETAHLADGKVTADAAARVVDRRHPRLAGWAPE